MRKKDNKLLKVFNPEERTGSSKGQIKVGKYIGGICISPFLRRKKDPEKKNMKGKKKI